jgi:hypothetical protein
MMDRRRELVAVERDGAGVGRVEACDGSGEGGLADAGWAGDGDSLAAGDGEREVVDDDAPGAAGAGV